ncbi:MAG: biopolymer transporter ExbD [Candidatus Accumulibacter sp.]|jgi:biopolymer transport protein ExbD|nr:biopolymer transporter ExbD [Accumulibacter sp.]
MDGEKPFESMNMIPFIDIMLVLLTIVLTTSSFIATGRLPVNLPSASAQKAQIKENWILEIDREGKLHKDGQPLRLEALLRQTAALDKETPFLLRADRAVALQSFIDVLDGLKQQGFGKIAVETAEK